MAYLEQIFLFGFSRGAYTARMTAALIVMHLIMVRVCVLMNVTLAGRDRHTEQTGYGSFRQHLFRLSDTGKDNG